MSGYIGTYPVGIRAVDEVGSSGYDGSRQKHEVILQSITEPRQTEVATHNAI